MYACTSLTLRTGHDNLQVQRGCRGSHCPSKQHNVRTSWYVLTYTTIQHLSHFATGGVFTKDINKALKVVDNVRAGTMWINTYNLTDTAVPFGGFKQSGYGRDLGEHALQAYTETKAVIIASDR